MPGRLTTPLTGSPAAACATAFDGGGHCPFASPCDKWRRPGDFAGGYSPAVGLPADQDLIDWLLDSDPALRWQVLGDLTDVRAAEVAAERIPSRWNTLRALRVLNWYDGERSSPTEAPGHDSRRVGDRGGAWEARS